MKQIYIAIFFFALSFPSYAQTKEVKRIVLVGNIGHEKGGNRLVLDAIKHTVPVDSGTTFLFLGDNEHRSAKTAFPAMDAQIALVRNTAAKAFFLPGDKDWRSGHRDGYAAIQKQHAYIKSLGLANVFMVPEDGCGGLAEIELGDSVLLLAMDTQWWLHKHNKPDVESDCEIKTELQLLDELDDALGDNAQKLIIFAGHHPLRSYGKHSNSHAIRQHIFPLTDIPGLRNAYVPLPFVGSLYPVARNFIYTRQNMIHPAYEEMISSLEGKLQWHPHVIRVAGHDHSLQLIQTDDHRNYIVSGAGSKITSSSDGGDVLFQEEKPGFTVLEIRDDKTVSVTFYTVDKKGGVKTAYKNELLNYRHLPPLAPDTAVTRTLPDQDSVLAVANSAYVNAGGLQRFLMGDNYRQEWATPVKMKVFRMQEAKGGLSIENLGGGKQSNSLHLVDSTGKEWTLRSINKDLEKAIPGNFRETFAVSVVQDVISAAHPYAPLSMPALSRALDVVHTNPQLVFVPNDSAFGRYRTLFANTVCMLEEHHPSRTDKKGDNAWEMFNKTIEKDDFTVDQRAFLTARMLDFLVADFDRHYDQWKWGTIDTGKGKVYYPIPKDRDQVFFYSNGHFLRALSNNRMPFLKGLRYKMPKVEWLGFSARDIDRLFLNRLSAKDWTAVLGDFERRVTDSVIDHAVLQLPKEVYPIHGPEIAAKLKSRRSLLPEEGLAYYKFLARYVTIAGSNKDDYFRITDNPKGITIHVYDRDKQGDTGFLRYSRVFDDNDTREIWLYGFNGGDYFNIDEKAKSRIKLRIIGGNGADTFNARGRQKNLIYDQTNQGNILLNAAGTRQRFKRHSSVNSFTIRENNFPMLRFPTLNAGYNPDDQFLVGIGGSLSTYGFRKEPYASFHKIGALFSFFNSAYQVRYQGEFLKVIGGLDLVMLAHIKNPALDFFYGLGNETIKDESRPFRFYQARFNYLQGDLMLRKRTANNLFSISLGPAYYRYWNNYEDNTGKVLEQPSVVRLDSAQVYGTQLYGGGKLSIRLNNINNTLLPTHGIDWQTDLTMMTGLDERTRPVTKLQSDVVIYASLTNPGRLVSVLRFGGGHIFSEHFEFFQSLRLGANHFLRGYRRDRFAGSSMAYGSAEFRLKLFDIKSRILPGDFGLIAFDDIGRVWMRGEESDTWHNSYGGGIYFTPFNMVAVGTTLAISEEDKLFNASIGTNIRIFF